ncbi:MAG: virulence RhuM family protein [Paludibacter sp.]|nr:virulence RhuM family protein [Paludibacter sp.]
MNTHQNEIILYQPDNLIKLEVVLENETVWLTQAQIAVLFGVKVPAISKHLKNIYGSGELEQDSTFSILENMGNDGKQIYQTKYYNLDAILSVGYRVNSQYATSFRRWATQVLKDYMFKGYAVSQRFERLEYRVAETEKKIDFFVKTALPPKEGIFYDGQIFDAYVFVSDLIKSAQKSIILLDNYIDESVLLLLSKRQSKVNAEIYTKQISTQLQLDLARHNSQYEHVTIYESDSFHDRFLLIDDMVYHIGASLKDLGKKLFAFSKMEIKAKDFLENVK